MNLRSRLIVTFIGILPLICLAQPTATLATDVKNALQAKAQLHSNSLVKNIVFNNVGPTIMNGRVTDLDVNPNDPTEFYVAYASGGVWHTTNNGTSFNPVLDTSNTQNVGDIAVDWTSGTLWVGTGENNASRSSYAGIGILKSTDNGNTWQHMGLTDSHHIGRILINPNNPDEVVIGATGHLYSTNNQRGVYKTTNGGQTWEHTLYIDDKTGIIDLQHDPHNFNIMFAASWTKDRKAWHFEGNGSKSSIYKSTDGGSTWSKISTPKSGFPTGEGVGRIGLAVFDENTVYALLDNQFRKPANTSTKESDALTKDDFKTMPVETFLKLDKKRLNGFLKANGFHEKYRAENVKQLVKSGAVKPEDVAKYLEDANSLLFDTPVIGAEVYKSTDGGLTWRKTHNDYIDNLYYSYGYYFGEIRVDPQDKNGIYVLGVPLLKSNDGGKTFQVIDAENVHVDHHALWVNPKRQGHLVNGNDGGVNITYDDGNTWIKNNSTAVGQFYAINIDNETPYNVYGGLQDNGVWVGPHNTRENNRWHGEGQYPWQRLLGGDGMQIQIDHRNANIVYTGFQFGNYFRINRKTGQRTYIQPKHNLGETPYRFNWQTPILLSPHNQDILYLGGNKLMRSMNQGDDWTAISDDLTNGGKKGNVAYGTITSISESPFQFGLLYTGSDDGLVYVTKDAGASWENIATNLPKNLWVSRVVASKHKKERVYASLNGYRWDDFSVYLYKSDNYGTTWEPISSNIPLSPVNVIAEDPTNENILYVGTDNGAYITFNQGNQWEAFNSVPNVAVHDMVIQPEAKDLLLATHGRSIYKTSIENLQQLTPEKLKQPLVLFNLPSVRHSEHWGRYNDQGTDAFVPKVTIPFYSNTAGKKNLKILSDKGTELYNFKITTDKGFNYFEYNLELTEKGKKALAREHKNIDVSKSENNKYYLPIGAYTIKIEGDTTRLEIK